MVTGRQFERYWPPGCIYANWPNYWAYQDMNPGHGWACPYDSRECPWRAVQVRRCQEELNKKKFLKEATDGEAGIDICLRETDQKHDQV